MTIRTRDILLHALGLPILIVVLGSSTVGAQTGGPYDLAWSTIDTGGNSMTGDTYSLDGTTGQPDAGELVGGTYRLGGGFWGSVGGAVTGVHEQPERASAVGIEPFRPNPFSENAVLGFTVARPQRVELRIFDVMGRLVRTLLNENVGAGRHLVNWDGMDNQGVRVRDGVYQVRLSATEFRGSTRVVYLKQ